MEIKRLKRDRKQLAERQVGSPDFLTDLKLFDLNAEADMATLSMFCAMTKENKPEIVWRNPNSLRGSRRRHNLAPSLGRGCYVLQEYDGYHGFWRTISDLKVVTGGRAA